MVTSKTFQRTREQRAAGEGRERRGRGARPLMWVGRLPAPGAEEDE